MKFGKCCVLISMSMFCFLPNAQGADPATMPADNPQAGQNMAPGQQQGPPPGPPMGAHPGGPPHRENQMMMPSNTPAVAPSAQMEQWATAALAAAKKLQAGGNDAAAYERYEYILKQYPHSTAAKDAQDAVTAYEANTDLMAKIHPKAATEPSAASTRPSISPAERAAGMLSLGENYLGVGKDDLARAKFQAVVQQFPDSPSAAAAKQHIADMDAAGR